MLKEVNMLKTKSIDTPIDLNAILIAEMQDPLIDLGKSKR